MERELSWEKWEDPFLTNIGEKEWPDWQEEKEEKLTFEEEPSDVEDVMLPLNGMMGKTMPNMHLIHTAFGFLPIINQNSPSSQFNFWVGHTNFDIDQTTKAAIEQVPGVEILDIFSAYRFRICIGKMFHSSDVKYQIQQVLNVGNNIDDFQQSTITPELKAKIEKTQENLSAKYDKWAFLVLPNGSFDITVGDDKDFKDKILIYKETINHVGGNFYESQ